MPALFDAISLTITLPMLSAGIPHDVHWLSAIEMGAKAVYVNALNMADGGQGHGPDGQTQHEKAGSEAPPSLTMLGSEQEICPV